MKENKLKIIIHRPIKEVFDFTINPKNTPLWIENLKEETAKPYPPKIGTIYKNTGDNKKWDSYEVIEFEQNKIFTLRASDGNYHVRYTYRMIDSNKTEMVYYEWVDRGKLDKPFSQKVLNKLKDVMEKKETDEINKKEFTQIKDLDKNQVEDKKIFNQYIFYVTTIFSAGLIFSLAKGAFLVLDNYSLSDYKILVVIFGSLFLSAWIIFASNIKSPQLLFTNIVYWILLLTGFYVYSIDLESSLCRFLGLAFILAGCLLCLTCASAPTRHRLWIFFFIVLFVSNIGMIFIDSNYGYHPIKSYLNINGDVRNRYSGQNGLECFSSDRIYVGSRVECKVNPPLSNMTSVVNATDLFGVTKNIDLDGNLQFIAPANNSNLYFHIFGTTQDQKEVYLSTSFKARFYSVEEDTKRNEKFLLGIYGLLVLVFISIPQIIKSIKEMAE